MKKIVRHEPKNMALVTVDEEFEVANDEVLIAIKHIGICGTDIHAYGGNQPFFDYPRVLGHELSGIAEEIGENVQGIQKGDQVTVIPYVHCGSCTACRQGRTNCCTSMQVIGVHKDGGMAEYLKVPQENVFKVNDLSLEAAATVEPLSIGAHAVRRADVQKEDTVLVIGAGPIGLGVARFTKLIGAKTILMDISEERLTFSQQWTEADATVKAGDNAVDELLALNHQELPTIVIDATGNKQSMEQAFTYVSHGGKLVYVGLVKDTISFSDPDFHSKELTLLGSRNATTEDFNHVIDCMAKGMIKEGYITNRIAFEEVPAFFAANDFRTNKTMISL